MKQTVSQLNADLDGCYWHIESHGRDELWGHLNEAQKVAVTLLEKWGWTLFRVDRDKFKRAHLLKRGEHNTVVNRS
jgi:hypothetical protein